MEFLKIIKRRSFINEFIYVILNVGLAVALLIIIRTTGSLWLAFLLILLSKWRVFAVRPRFWFAHIQSDLVSLIINVSFVVFLYAANTTNMSYSRTLIAQIILVLFYIGWLVFLKSQSKRVYVVAQAAIALFVGVSAIYAMSYDWIASPVVLLMWLVGYATARHILSSYEEEKHVSQLSLAWGLVLAEIGWLAYHWTIAYQLPIFTELLLPQVSIIVLAIGFVVYKSYNSYYHHQVIRFNDIILPLLFSIGIIVMLVLAFNGVSVNTV